MTEFNLTGEQAEELMKQGHQCQSEKYPTMIEAYHKKSGNFYYYYPDTGFPHCDLNYTPSMRNEKYRIIDAPRMKWEDSKEAE